MKFTLNCPHLDAAETIFTQRALEHIRAKTYDIKYAQLRGRTLIPVDNSVSPAAETITYQQFNSVGMAQIISNYSTRLPRSDVFMKEFTVRVRSIGNAYGYNIQEVRAAQLAKQDLPARKATAARQAYEQKIDKIAQLGDTDYGLLGLLNQPNTTLYTVPNGAGGSALWTSKTPDEILADLNGIVNKIIKDTQEVEAPDVLVLPTDQLALIKQKARSTTSDVTIAQFFLNNQEHIKQLVSWAPLATAGAGSTARMVAYRRSEEALQLVIPQEFEQLAPYTSELEIVTPCHGRCAGVVVYYPLSIAYGDGI
jgi:hypothetical protein